MAARLLRSWVRIPPVAWMFVLSVVGCQVEVSTTGWSLIQRSPTDCDASLCVILKPQQWGGHGPRWAAAPQKKKVWLGLGVVAEMSHKWLRSLGSQTYATNRRLSYRGRKVCWYRRTSLEGWAKKGKVAGKRRNVNGCRRSECLRISCVPDLSLNAKLFLIRTMYLKCL